MTGPEHFREAERLLATAFDGFRTAKEAAADEPDLMEEVFAAAGTAAAPAIAAAQVHATLALAAATAMSRGLPKDYVERAGATKAWHEVGAW